MLSFFWATLYNMKWEQQYSLNTIKTLSDKEEIEETDQFGEDPKVRKSNMKKVELEYSSHVGKLFEHL